MKSVIVAGLVALGFSLSGCASIIEGSTTNVAITTPPADGAKCELKNSQGIWYVTSPGTAQVHRTKTDLNVKCTKDGYDDASAVIPSTFNGATVGNVLAGGIIGIGVDAATGANYSYPKTYEVPMKPKADTPIPASSDGATPPKDNAPPST